MAVTVLVVDRDITFCALLGRLLTNDGYAIATATTSEQALELLATAVPAIIVTAFDMPVVGGDTLFDRLQERGVSFPIVVIAPEATPLPTVVTTLATAILRLPFDADHLLRTVARLIPPEGVP